MYRNTDPQTSQDAATELMRSGKLSERRFQVLSTVNLYPERTHAELAVVLHQRYPELGLTSCTETPHKRLPELKDLDFVEAGAPRKCRVTGKHARTWRITPKGRLAIINAAARRIAREHR